MKNWTKGLALAITLGLMGGITSPVMAETVYDRPNNADGILAKVKKDGKWLGEDQIKEDGDKIIYNLKDDTVINAKGGANARGVYINPGNDVEINVMGGQGTLTLNSESTNRGNGPATGINLSDGGSKLVVNGNLDIALRCDGNFATGIGLNLDGTGKGEEGHIVINGNVKMRRDDPENPWGLVTRNIYGGYGQGGSASKDAPMYSGARWAPSAIKIGVGHGSTIDLNGDVDLAIRGNAITTQSYYDGDCVINLNSGNVTIDTPDSDKDHFYVAGAFGGTININSENNINNNVNLRGNIISMYRDPDRPGGWERDFYFKNGHINIGLVNDQSKWTGIIDNSGKSEAGDVNIALQNGAIWDHYEVSPANGMDVAHMPEPSINFYGEYNNVSYVNNFRGSMTREDTGYIYQNDDAQINILKYSGNTVVIYDHNNKGTQNSDYTGGDIIIGNAARGSRIILSTSNEGIDMQNNSEVGDVLNALASKLVYKAYTKGEQNLLGEVQIASGLTASAASLRLEDITFQEESGRGSYIKPLEYSSSLTGKDNPEYAEAKTEDGYKFKNHASITVTDTNAIDVQNNMVLDATGKNLTLNVDGAAEISGLNQSQGHEVTINANLLKINMASQEGKGNGIILAGRTAENTAKMVINADTEINLASSAKGGYGIAVSGNSELLINGHVVIADNKLASPALYHGYYRNPGIWASGDKDLQKGASVVITEGLDSAKRGVFADGYGSSVTIKGDSFIGAETDAFALGARNASININLDDELKAVEGANTIIEGNILLDNRSVNNEPVNNSTINLGLGTNDSRFRGVIVRNLSESDNAKGYLNQANLYLANGAEWVNQVVEEIPSTVTNFTGSTVDRFAGDKGYIYQKDEHDLTIKDYTGNTTVIYEHSSEEPTKFTAGNIVITKAAEKSSITMFTENNGISMNNTEQVDAVMNALANKLVYEEAKKPEAAVAVLAEESLKLDANIKIASGLTASASGCQGKIVFDKNGVGSFDTESKEEVVPDTSKPDNPQNPEKPLRPLDPADETPVMLGVRSAMMDSMLAWRDVASDVFSRAEDLRAGKTEGVWAKALGGKVEFDGSGEFKNSYWGAQTGYDRALSNGWNVGVAVDYRDGSGDYAYGGEGDTDLYSIGAYAGKLLGEQAYVDFAFKAGRIANDFTVHNETGQVTVDGEYAARGYALSTQLGRRFGTEEKGYFEPQLQFTWAHVDGDEYTALDRTDRSLAVDQNAFDSFVAKMSLKAGRASERGGIFAKLSLAHEFGGDVETSYYAADGGNKNVNFETSDTWSELTLGGNYLVRENLRVYADLTRGLSGDYQHQWKLNAGINYNF